MKENKKKLKGFTLIELIIVLAIFSVILALVMSFIDPVSGLMKRTSIKERTAAYVDNITEYVDDSLHYAKYMRVYDGGFCDKDDSAKPITEEEAVRSLVDDVFTNAVDADANPITGKVRVLKFVNTPDGSVLTQEGQIYESVYDFKSRQDYEDINKEIKTISESVLTLSQTNAPIVNVEHFKDYGYYYSTGFKSFTQLTNADVTERNPANYKSVDGSVANFNWDGKVYYSVIVPLKYTKSDGTTGIMENTVTNFAMNVTSFKNEKGVSGKIMSKYNDGTGLPEDAQPTVPVFRNPAYLTTASMSLVNIDKARQANEVVCVRPLRKSNGDFDTDASGEKQFKSVNTIDIPTEPFMTFEASYGKDKGLTDNVYIIFIIPEEINDTMIVYN